MGETGLRRERVSKGLCPNCGAEAAPYYLCDECHCLRQLGRALRDLEREGLVALDRDPSDRRRQTVLWIGGDREPRPERSRRLGFGERGKPRLRGVPVDVEAELFGIFERAGRPLTIGEIREAWVRLRPKPGRSAPEALAAIVRAGDKRARRREKKARLAT